MGYRYIKAPAAKEPEKSIDKVPGSQRKKYAFASKGLVVIGALLVANVLWPIVSYELFTAPGLKEQSFLSPVPTPNQASAFSKSDERSSDPDDFTLPQNWFPSAPFPQRRDSKITHYTLSIPKLNITQATVEINGKDLSESLIHYPGTALPGEVGAPVIFGHSILPQFFNPENYMAIFSLLPTLEFGDEIIVKFDGITYTYKVFDKTEVKPDNISVLEQPYDNEYLRLITCTPPGTYLRRGVISAALID